MRHDGNSNQPSNKEEKTMKEIKTIGLDLAKNVFHLVACNEYGKIIMKKKLKRQQILNFFANLQVCLIGTEACAGSHYWGRELRALGHEVHWLSVAVPHCPTKSEATWQRSGLHFPGG